MEAGAAARCPVIRSYLHRYSVKIPTMNYCNFKVKCFAQEFDPDEVPEMRRTTHCQACARRKAISAQTRMSRARLAARSTATDSNEIPQGPTELVRAPVGKASSSGVSRVARSLARRIYQRVQQTF